MSYVSLSGIGDGIPLVSMHMGDLRGGEALITKHPDSHSTAMFAAHSGGTVIDRAALQGDDAYLTYKLTGCLLTSYRQDDELETWGLGYTGVLLHYADASTDSVASSDVAEPTAVGIEAPFASPEEDPAQ